MSQVSVSLPGGGPSIPTSFITDDGTAIPVANTLNIIGEDTSEDNDNGIQTAATPDLGDTVAVQLTNRMTASVNTTDGSTVLCLSFDLGATPATYAFSGTVCGYNVTTPGSHVTDFAFAARTDGTIADAFGANFFNSFEEASMAASNVSIGDTGGTGGNEVEVFVIGIAGQTIHWSVVMQYRKVV